MSTVSLVTEAGRSVRRLVVNRDERRTRPVAWPPQVVHWDGMPVVCPVDPEGGGTWVAASAAGVAFALCSANGAAPSAVPPGLLIPRLASASSAGDAVARLQRMDLSGWAAFTLLVTGPDGHYVARHARGRALGLEPAHAPLVVSSSLLGDDLVEAPRRDLFASMLQTGRSAREAQDRFHAHAWPDRRHLSVVMSRVDARTVSRTAVTLGREHVTMNYEPLIEGWPGPTASRRLAIASVAVAV
jgi:hypothetical protein